ncbi:MAG TPA: kelch repeat-containing protein, partial [Myxococcaceae bacterium]|nr:kelch repeat-containing protein [Myxococcaceae bacterium]
MVRSSGRRRRPAGRGRGQGSVRPVARRGWDGGVRRVLATVAALVLGPACAPGEARYEVRLLTESCMGTPPLEGVHYLRFRLIGEGLAPVDRYVPVERGAEGVPEVPAGRARVLEVRGYTALPGEGGRVVSVGRSHPFDVPESAGDGRPTVPVALRRVGEYSRPGSAEDGCLLLGTPRAGHTATLLADGRVLLAGGYELDLNGVRTVLSSAELFDPVSSTLEPLPALEVEGRSAARAFHTATRLPDGKVFLAGGEVDSPEGPTPLNRALLVDVAERTYSEVVMPMARSHHAAALDEGGRVLLVGGVEAGGNVVQYADGYEAGSGRTFVVGTPVPRVGMGLVPVQGGQGLAVVGGSDGWALRPEVLLFRYNGSNFSLVNSEGRLREPRRDAALVSFGGPEQLLLLGGYDSP